MDRGPRPVGLGPWSVFNDDEPPGRLADRSRGALAVRHPRREIVHGRGCTPMKRDIYLYRPPRVAGYIMLQCTKKDWQRQGGDSWLDTGQLAAVSQLVDLSQLGWTQPVGQTQPVG